MWVKDVRNYYVEIYEGDNMIYSGDVNDVSDELKERETKTMKIDHKKLIIYLLQDYE